jgi:hypothetical protein
MADTYRRDLNAWVCNECGKNTDDCRCEPLSQYEVIVGNVGMVYAGADRQRAIECFSTYRDNSVNNAAARCYGEDVTLFTDGEISSEHQGHLHLN